MLNCTNQNIEIKWLKKTIKKVSFTWSYMKDKTFQKNPQFHVILHVILDGIHLIYM